LKTLIEYLRQLGHEPQIFPESHLSTIFLPATKTGIIFGGKNNLSSEQKLNVTGDFSFSQLQKQGIQPVLIMQRQFFDQIDKSDNLQIIAFLEKENIPNINKDKKYDFSKLEENKPKKREYQNKKKQESSSSSSSSSSSDEEDTTAKVNK
jgi:hypothetical protein